MRRLLQVHSSLHCENASPALVHLVFLDFLVHLSLLIAGFSSPDKCAENMGIARKNQKSQKSFSGVRAN